jgi:peptidoglycan hydrolase CwlO-like protein
MAAWIWIPIVAILAGTFKEWMQFKSKQDRLGDSTHDLKETVRTLHEALDESEKERRRLTERMQNVETIVTSQAWDALPSETEPGEPERLGNDAARERDAESAEKSRALAKRMQT